QPFENADFEVLFAFVHGWFKLVDPFLHEPCQNGFSIESWQLGRL
ncbi:MAG: hypothetical protein ACJAZV_001976, partial [Roseivirga sp.]